MSEENDVQAENGQGGNGQGGNDFMAQVRAAFDDLKTLDIRTVVGKYEIDKDKIKFDPTDADTDALTTQIDLLSGDITTAMSEKFLEPPYSVIRDFHMSREKEAQNIIERNIKAIQSLIQLFKDVIDKPDDEENKDVAV